MQVIEQTASPAPSPNTEEAGEYKNQNLGAEATGRSFKIVINEFLLVECKLA